MIDPAHTDPLEATLAALRRLPVPERPADAELLAQLRARHPRSPASHSSFRRFLMRPTIRYATAAAALFAVFAWLILSPSGSLALADVIEATAKHKLVRYQLKQICDDRQNGSAEGHSTVYVDLQTPRLRVESGGKTFNNVLEFRSVMVQDNQHDRFLNLLTQTLIVTEKEAKDDTQRMMIKIARENGHIKKVAQLHRVGKTPDDVKPFSDMKKDKPFLDQLREFQHHQDTVTTKAMLNGRETIKYRLEEDNKTSTLWVDPKSKLPVRMEFDVVDPTPRIARNQWIYTDFDWNPPVQDVEQFFSTKPPEEFTVEDHTKDG